VYLFILQMAGVGSDGPSGTRSISEAEWEEAKGAIEELYMEQRKQLSDVVKIMAAEYGFVAK
jgi:hypothetical protein